VTQYLRREISVPIVVLHGTAWHGGARRGGARQRAGASGAHAPVAPASHHYGIIGGSGWLFIGVIRHCMALHGTARPGEAWRGAARGKDGRTHRRSLILATITTDVECRGAWEISVPIAVLHGAAWQGEAGRGAAWHGAGRGDDGPVRRHDTR